MVRERITDDEWAFFAPFLVRTGARSGRPPTDHRLVLDAIFWIARTGAPWRDLDISFPKWTRVYRQFRRWTLAGVWDVILEALNDSAEGQASVQMIDSTIVRAHRDCQDFRVRAAIMDPMEVPDGTTQSSPHS